MKTDPAVQVRQAEPSKAASAKNTQRQVGDIMLKVSGFTFIPCSCGVQLKLPPDYKARTVQCPRCGKSHNI